MLDVLAKIASPTKVEIKELEGGSRVILSPFERGYGYSICNGLRRILLSSIPGYSIVGVVVEGVNHEFSDVSGLSGDLVDFVLNLKNLSFSFRDGRKNGKMELEFDGPGVVFAKDLVCSGIEIFNPDFEIAVLGKKAKFKATLYFSIGIGYVPSYAIELKDYLGDLPIPADLIKVDALFSPVKKVMFTVESTRVSQDIDFDKVIFDIATDGSITAVEAMKCAANLLRTQFIAFADLEGLIESSANRRDDRVDDKSRLLAKKIGELDLTVRSVNCLRYERIDTVADLVERTERDLLRTPNFGKKSLDEIKEALKKLGFSLKG